MVDFVSPITRHHSANLLAAVAVVWNDRRESGVPKHLSVSRSIEVLPKKTAIAIHV